MNSSNKTAIEKKWLDTVVEFATESNWLVDMYGNYCYDPKRFEIDHILGAKAKRKINGVSVKVGEFAIMPIPYELHNVMSKNPLNRTTQPAAFRSEFGKEGLIFHNLIWSMWSDDIQIPFENDLIEAVMR